jgi:hypothetical protein
MNTTVDAFLRSWPWDPWLLAALVASGVLYARRWSLLHERDAERWRVGR